MPTIYEALEAAIECHQAGDLGQAEQLYRQILQIVPNHADTLHLLGVLASQVHQDETAIDLIGQAIELQPEKAYFHYNLALALESNGQLSSAMASLQRALQLDSNYPLAHFNLGLVQQKLGLADACVKSFERAIQLQPQNPQAYFQLGLAFIGLRDHPSALQAFQEALKLYPDYIEALNNLGNIYKSQGQLSAAADIYRRALGLAPTQPDIHLNLGNVFFAENMLEDAVLEYQRSIAIRPTCADAHKALADVLQELGQHERALQSYRQARQLDPRQLSIAIALANQMQHVCEWEGLEALSSSILTSLEARGFEHVTPPIVPLGIVSLPVVTTASLQLQCAKAWARSRCYESGAAHRPRAPKLRSNYHKLRIGYLSGDFRVHPVGFLVGDLFESHDRELFNIFGYSFGPDDGSPIRRRLESSFDFFRDIRRHSFQEAAEQIERDEIDILVDLQGYTQNCRTEILTFRPAPIQVNYLGYAATMGADFVDYILVDEFAVPADQQPYFTEQLVHLPGCFMVNDRKREIAHETPTRGELGLPENGIVFCGFSAPYKIKQAMFECWLRLLEKIPGSVLWLRDANAVATANLRREATRHGIAEERLVFAPKVPMPEHLARHRRADLFLDSFPYNQHSTASDALRMGLPLLTLCGHTFASRVAGSLLNGLGMPELIVDSLDAYEALAFQLAMQPDRLMQVRQQLATNLETTTLYNAGVLTRHIEKAYQSMWRTYQGDETRRDIPASRPTA